MRSDRPAEKRWFATTAPEAGRYDDIHFLSEAIGWAINSKGQILKTEDGGEHWQEQANFERWLRCITMVDEQIGWVGGKPPRGVSLKTEDILFKTTDGRSWNPVTNLPMKYRSPDDADSPSAICGLHALPDGKHVFAAGTNHPKKPTRFLRSSDGGESWTCRDMGKYAALLVDVYFENEREGWLAGGRNAPRAPSDENVVAEIWHTVDGGATWRGVVGDQVDRPRGEEWGWKIQFVDNDFIVVSTQSDSSASILISEDHGRRWVRREVHAQGRLQGIGFLDRRRGWVSGWGPHWDGLTSMTEDGGNTWRDATPDFETPESGARPPQLARLANGQDINRFRVIRGDDPVIYAAGRTVYKYADAPVRAPSLGAGSPPPLVIPQDLLRVADGPVSFIVELPAGARRLVIHIYDHFADRKRTIMEDDPRPPGPHPVVWDIADDDGRPLPPGAYVLQVSCDDRCEFLMILVGAHHERGGTGSDEPER